MNKPNPKISDLATYRSTSLSQMHQGELEVETAHPILRFMLKSSFVLNIGGLILLWVFFRFLDMFPPHDMPFLPAFAWYFFFGTMYGLFAYFSFRFAKGVEKAAIQRSLTHNRRYEWHALHDKNMTKAELNKVPKPAQQVKPSEAIGAGAKYFRMTAFLILASLFTFYLGVSTLISAPL